MSYEPAGVRVVLPTVVVVLNSPAAITLPLPSPARLSGHMSPRDHTWLPAVENFTSAHFVAIGPPPKSIVSAIIAPRRTFPLESTASAVPRSEYSPPNTRSHK